MFEEKEVKKNARNDKENENNKSVSKNMTDVKETCFLVPTSEKESSSDLYTDEMYRNDRCEMFKNLNSNEIRALRVYVRGPVFNKIKFVNGDKTGRDSKIISDMFKVISINNDKEKQNLKFHGVRHILQRQLNSKRNYTNEKITKTAVGKYL